jgi:tetratricopeptide (TPR) repeat protein
MYRFLLLVLLMLLTGWVRLTYAQDVRLAYNSPEYQTADAVVRDSLAALHRYAQAGQPVAVERIATFLLTRYPGRISFYIGNSSSQPSRYLHLLAYPQQAYARRAEVRRQRGDRRGATADFALALRYGELAYRGNERTPNEYHFYQNPAVAFLRATYYARALFRLEDLHDPAGGCQDMGFAYQLDTVRAASPRWRGCVLPAARVSLDYNAPFLSRLALDSVAAAQRLLNQHRLVRAEQFIAQLEAGRVGEYARVPPPVNQLRYLRSQLARQHHDYRRAVAYLDTLLPDNYGGDPRHRYERGLLRLDHLNDRAGGCEDLRWVYDHDTASTGPTDPRWRGCPLPARKVPVGNTETAAHRAAFLDSVARATALCRAGRGDIGLPIFNRLLAVGAAGTYAPEVQYFHITGQLMHSTPRLAYSDLNALVRDARARAYEALRDYPGAVADLDTLIQYFDNTSRQNADWHCRRGVLLADFLHNQTQACADLAECRRRGGTPPGNKPWRGCDIPELTAGYRLGHTQPLHALFGDLRTVTPRVGYFAQGRAHGLEAGLQWSEKGEGYINYGPSIGLEVATQPSAAGRNLLLAPKLSYEAELLLAGIRLDLAYYVGTANGRTVGDLRLTP